MTRHLEPAQHYFVDESGDAVLFDAQGRCIVGQEGVSKTFILGAARIANPTGLQTDLNFLRLQLLSDPYFRGVPSFDPARRKTALYFHAKDDPPEVRRDVFRVLQAHEIQVIAAFRRKKYLAEFASRRFDETGQKISDEEIYDTLVERIMSNRLHLAEHSHIWFARRGKRERKQALENVIAKARAAFIQRYPAAVAARLGSREPKTTIYPAHPSEVAGLQAVDYCLWALNRLLERDEARYFELIKSKFRLIWDIDDVGRKPSGEYYWGKKRRAIDCQKILPVVS